MPQRAQAGLEVLTRWILDRNPGREHLGPDEDLIENRLVDSLSFVEFIFLVEEAAGVEIDVNTLDLADVRTLDAIQKRFLS